MSRDVVEDAPGHVAAPMEPVGAEEPALQAAGVEAGDAPALPGWRRAPSPISVLRACGWLAAADAASPRLRIDATSSSHALFRVTAPDGRCVVVKQLPRESAERARSLRHEIFIYRLAAWMPEIAALVPAPVFLDEARQVVVVQSLSLGERWPDPAALVPIGAPGAASALGAALGRLHRATLDMGMWPSPAAGVLGLSAGLELACQGRAADARELLRRIAADPLLRDLLDQGLAGYQPRCVIHGDLRPENWLRDERLGASAQNRDPLRLFDWEMAGSGDPLWDLGSLVAEAVVDSIRRDAAGHGPWPDAGRAAITESLRAYLSHGGLLSLDDAAAWRRLALLGAARLLHVATECAEQGVDAGLWPVIAFTTAARRIAGDLVTAAGQLRLWAAA